MVDELAYAHGDTGECILVLCLCREYALEETKGACGAVCL